MSLLGHHAITIEQRLPQRSGFRVGIENDAVVECLVKRCSSFWIGQQLIGGINRIKSIFCTRLSASIRMVTHGECTVRFFYFIVGGCRRDAENVVRVIQKFFLFEVVCGSEEVALILPATPIKFQYPLNLCP